MSSDSSKKTSEEQIATESPVAAKGKFNFLFSDIFKSHRRQVKAKESRVSIRYGNEEYIFHLNCLVSVKK